MTIAIKELGKTRETRAFRDLREFLAAIDQPGQLKRIDGAHWDLEIGALTHVVSHRKPSPALLFDNIPDVKPGWRVLTNMTNLADTWRERIIYGCPPSVSDAEAVEFWKEELKRFSPLPPIHVSDGPVKENVRLGEDVDLLELPWVRWHELDGGRYMCATSCVTRDPDSGYVNLGSYRFMLVDHNTIVVHIAAGHHGDVIRKKYWDQGKPCPMQIVLGQEPSIFIAAAGNSPWGEPEYDLAGWIRGEPVEITPGVVYPDLPIPATAEVVLEVDMLPPGSDTAVEGPFAEATGYYGGGAHPSPLVKVRSILHRDNPIVQGSPIFFHDLLGSRTPRVWSELDRLGVPGIVGMNYRGGSGTLIISLKQSFPGHPMRAALGAMGGTAGQHPRFIIVVDEDIDPYDLGQVLWAVGTRCEPAEQLDIVRRISSFRIDPRMAPDKREAGDYTCSTAIIDACRPYHWRDKFPPATGITPELRHTTEAKWGAVLDA